MCYHQIVYKLIINRNLTRMWSKGEIKKMKESSDTEISTDKDVQNQSCCVFKMKINLIDNLHNRQIAFSNAIMQIFYQSEKIA